MIEVLKLQKRGIRHILGLGSRDSLTAPAIYIFERIMMLVIEQAEVHAIATILVREIEFARCGLGYLFALC